jgi:3-hydroxyacyl-CoA dehydrogenase/enoyl-CoA hydratase/3-hydroxybutyryl-CoA epimerase
MHYFSPVNKMPLLEVIATEKTAPWAIATAVALGKKQGKTVIVVHDGAGFYTSRILAPYLNEAVALVSEGVSVKTVDRALVEFGFPVGPLALLDEVGLDVAAKVAGVLHEAFGDRIAPAPATKKLLDDDRLGRKNGRGFYRYDEDANKGRRPVDPLVYGALGAQPNTQKTNAEITERVVLSMVNEAARCVSEGILRSARDGDAGAIFGLGFPPYLGGPFRYADSLGPKEVVARLERLATEHGERFKPAERLVELAKDKQGFYSQRE